MMNEDRSVCNKAYGYEQNDTPRQSHHVLHNQEGREDAHQVRQFTEGT